MAGTNQLMDGLKDSNASIRIDAAIALGQTGDARAVEPLIAAWRDSDENVRGTALSAVSKIGIPAIEPLIDAMKHPEIGVRTKASCALDRIGELMEAAKDFRAVEPLIDVFSEESHRIRTHIASTLGKLGDLRAFQPLIKELKNPKGAHVRTAEALGKLGDARAIIPLEDALRWQMNRSDPNITACQFIVHALEKLGSPSLDLLALFSKHPNPRSRRKLAWLLGGFNNPEATELLIEMLKDPHPHVRSRTVQALSGFTSDTRVIQPLISALADKAINVRIQAIHALGGFGKTSVVPLKQMLQDETASVRRHAIAELGKIGDMRVISEFESVAKHDSDNSVRLTANRVLQRIKPEQSVQAFRNSFNQASAMIFQ